MLLTAATALGAPFFLAAGPETPIAVDRSGNWPRVIAAEEGWSFFFASGGDYWYAPLDDALAADPDRTRPLTGRGDLVDHAITPCPDGGFLHAASYTVDNEDDSLVTYAYGADLELTDELTIVEGSSHTITRDMPVVCGETYRGVGLFDTAERTQFVAVAGGEADEAVALPDAPMMTGSGWIESNGALWTIGHAIEGWGELQLRSYDAAFELQDGVDYEIVPAPLEAYWSQGLVRVGDHSVVVFMARDPDAGWQLQDGDVWLALLDADWNVVETLQVTTNTPPVGAMQPGLAVKDDHLLVTYVRDLELFAVEVAFDPELPAASEDASPDAPGAVAGCAGDARGLLFLPLLCVGRRRLAPSRDRRG